MSKPKANQPERRRLKLSQLVPYPLQSQEYPPTSEEEDERLRAVLRKGHYDPLHVMPPNSAAGLPANTLLDGHRRSRLLADLGFVDAEVVVRHDLANASRATVDMTFYDFALGRRHSHPLDLARMVLRKYELEKGRPRGGLKRDDEPEARDRVGKAIGMSGRHLQRLFRILLTPREVQNAVRDRPPRRLPMVMAEKVESLPKAKQTEIAGRIAAGEDAKTVVREYLAVSGNRRDATYGLDDFFRGLRRALGNLDGRAHEIPPHNFRGKSNLLQQGKHLIDQLLAQTALDDEPAESA